jgi:hypothetical protein
VVPKREQEGDKRQDREEEDGRLACAEGDSGQHKGGTGEADPSEELVAGW